MGCFQNQAFCTLHLTKNVHPAEQMDKGGKGKKRACHQGCCSGRPHQEEGRVDQSSPGPREAMWTPGCWSQMLSSLRPAVLLLLALVMMATRMKHWGCVGRIRGTQPEEEVGVGQMTTLGQPVHCVMSQSCTNATHQTRLACDKHESHALLLICCCCVLQRVPWLYPSTSSCEHFKRGISCW